MNNDAIQVPFQLVKKFVNEASDEALIEALRKILGNLRLRSITFEQIRPYVRILCDEIINRDSVQAGDLESLKWDLWEDVRSNILRFEQIEKTLNNIELGISKRGLRTLFGG